LELSDSRHEITWEIVSSDPPISVMSVVHTIRLRRVSELNTTFVEWTSDFSRDASAVVTEDARFKQKENFAALAAHVAKRFTFNSTAEEVVNGLGYNGSGKVMIITGASAGLGVETARVLLKAKVHVIAAIRDVEKGKAAFSEIVRTTPHAKLDFMKLDLQSLPSVRQFAAEFKAKNLPLHCLILNAGVMAVPDRQVTEQKIELQFGVNHVAHHLLTVLLLDVLKQSAPSRIVVVSSAAHYRGPVLFDDINSEKSYQKWIAYAQSKTANVLFAKQLNVILQKEGKEAAKVTVLSLHPGVIATELTRHMDPQDMAEFKNMRYRRKTIPQGAATTLVAALSPDFEGRGGVYLSDCNEMAPAPHASDLALAQRLWDVTEQIIKDKSN